jgi:hypothetical protein
MLKRRDEIAIALKSWWPAAAPHIADGRKSVQLGGCVLGMRQSKARLGHDFATDDQAAVALFKSRFRKHTTRIKVALDRTATLKLLQIGGKTAAAIAALGFKIEPGADVFFVERVQQDRTVGS